MTHRMTIAALACLIAAAAGCKSQPPRVVQTPNVCPAPRAVPSAALVEADSLPAELPTLPADLNPDAAAVAILIQREQTAQMYHRARVVVQRLSEWIRAQ